jgi:hypothetical protein
LTALLAAESSPPPAPALALVALHVQMRTVLSWLADAMYDFCRMVGAQATSRTQSVWPVSVSVVLYDFNSGLGRKEKK